MTPVTVAPQSAENATHSGLLGSIALSNDPNSGGVRNGTLILDGHCGKNIASQRREAEKQLHNRLSTSVSF